MRYNLNFTLTAVPNSKAISGWANVPPYFPFRTISPIAFVLFTHSETEITKLGIPAWDLKWSNSTTLKLGLWICSQTPKNSKVYLVRSQFLIISADLTLFSLEMSCLNFVVFSVRNGHHTECVIAKRHHEVSSFEEGHHQRCHRLRKTKKPLESGFPVV